MNHDRRAWVAFAHTGQPDHPGIPHALLSLETIQDRDLVKCRAKAFGRKANYVGRNLFSKETA
jgi:hypothetical protein